KELYGPLGVCVAPMASGGRKSAVPGEKPPADAGGSPGLRVFVCQSPDILVFEDADGDLKADGPPKKFLTGFGGFDHDHGVHGINIGPDGKLYFTVGDAGVNGLQGTDKKGPVFKSNTTTIQKGTVWRCDIDGSHLELIAHNFRNNYECCVDSFGEIWLSDNDDDGNQQTRICFVMPGGNYGYGPRGDGKSHWHEEDPGIVHKTLRTGFGSPTGITFYEGSLFPKKYSGSLLHCDAGPREVRAFFRKPKGAGYELDKEVILTSTDNWFRPSDVCVAPDGSIFVADWYDKGVGGHGMNDPQDGRIYRLTPKGHKGYKVPEVKLDTKEGLIAALGSPCQATRAIALNWIRSLTPIERVRFLLPALSIKSSVIEAVRANWAVNQRNDGVGDSNTEGNEASEGGRKLMDAVLSKRQDFAFLFRWIASRPDLANLFAGKTRELTFALLKDGDAGGLRELLLAMRTYTPKEFTDIFYGCASHYDGKDISYRAALNIACGTEPKRREEILADFDKHFPEWNDTVADLVWELRPKSVLPRLGK